jgi:hypothetical protein
VTTGTGDGPTVSRTAAPGSADLLRDLAELLSGETPPSRRFLGGLVAGALVGAAIAGSVALRRAGRMSREPREDR